jgi:hypothetical protein
MAAGCSGCGLSKEPFAGDTGIVCGMILALMNLSSPLQYLAADPVASPEGVTIRCAAANFRWEQAASVGRTADYNAYVGDVATHKEWQREHEDYLRSFVRPAKDHPRVAETFRAGNSLAHLQEDLDNTILLRLEGLASMVDSAVFGPAIGEAFWLRFFKSQKDLRKDKLADADEKLRSEFVTQWKEQRVQARPMFATFLNDFGGNLTAFVKTDWPHILRDRLGLTHWPSTPGKPVPVALICYTLDEVRQARLAAARKGAAASFSRPTVLDTEMSAAFVPAPLQAKGQSYGYTLDLADGGVPAAFTP